MRNESIDRLAEARGRTDVDLAAGRPLTSLVEEVALGLDRIGARSTREVPADLVHQVVAAGQWTPEQAPAQVAFLEPSKRERVARPLLPVLGPDDRVALLALLSPESVRLLAALAVRLEGAERTAAVDRALDVTLALGPDSTRADLLATLVDLLDGTQVEKALDGALRMVEEFHRLWAAGALASRLDRAQRDRVLAAVAGADPWRTSIDRPLAALGPFLDADQLDRALALALATPDLSHTALVAVIPFLGTAQRSTVLGAAHEMPAAERVRVLIPMLPDGAVLTHARAAAEAHPYELERLTAMTQLCPYLPDRAWRDTILAGIADVADEHSGANRLIAVFPYLDAGQQDAARAAALAFVEPSSRRIALGA